MKIKKSIKIDPNREVGWAYSFYFCEFNFSIKVHLRQTTLKIPSKLSTFVTNFGTTRFDKATEVLFYHSARVAHIFRGNKNTFFRPSVSNAFYSAEWSKYEKNFFSILIP